MNVYHTSIILTISVSLVLSFDTSQITRWSKNVFGLNEHGHENIQNRIDTSSQNQELKFNTEINSYSRGSINTEQKYDDKQPRWLFRSLFSPFFSLQTTSCVSQAGENGTCVSESQCRQTGGTSTGSCARGLATCCVYFKTCGESITRNNSYFVNPGYPSPYSTMGACTVSVNPASNICQLRLDFDDFSIAGPETTDHQCTQDRFIVSGSDQVPVICGQNTGNHMYVSAGSQISSQTVLTFISMNSFANRTWKIRVAQIPCNVNYLAPAGCLQYYTGASGRIQSYNYDVTNGLQLSNQDYTSCIRTEESFCRIEYTPCSDTVNTEPQSFTLTGSAPSGSLTGAGSCTDDWLTVACAGDPSNPTIACQDRFCGGKLNLASGLSTAVNSAISSSVRPFQLIYRTNAIEQADGDTNNRGYCLDYVQAPC